MGVMKQYQQRYQLRTISTFLPCERWKTSVQPKCYETISLYNQKAMCNKNKPYKSLKSRNIGTRNRYAVTFGIAATVFSLINGYINFRLFAYDALSEHSTKDEIAKFMKSKRLDFLILGILTSALLLFPPLFLVVPLYTALCFTRFAFAELIQFRALDRGQ